MCLKSFGRWVVFGVGITMSTRVAIAGTPDISVDLEGKASEAVKVASKTNDPVFAVQKYITRAGYVESQLLRAQDRFVEYLDDESHLSQRTAFLAIHGALMGLWQATEATKQNNVLKRMLAVASDKSYSWRLRRHYFKRAQSFFRDYRGSVEIKGKMRSDLLIMAKSHEADKYENSEVRAEALNTIGTVELNDQERRRIILSHCRGSESRLRREAVSLAGLTNNHDDAIVDELLTQYQGRKKSSDILSQELSNSLTRISHFARSPEEQRFKSKILRKLEELMTMESDPDERLRLKETIKRGSQDAYQDHAHEEK